MAVEELREAWTLGAVAAEHPFVELATEIREVVSTDGAIRGRHVAFRVDRHLAPHPRLETLGKLGIEGVVLPAGRFAVDGGDWIACRVPAGRPMSVPAEPVGDTTLIELILKPAAAALARMAGLGLTHRALTPGTVLLGSGGAVLGPFWLLPPAFGVPAAFLTPPMASSVPEGRGAGTIADDIYALGVTLLALHTGRMPLAGWTDEAVVAAKMRFGSLPALLEGRRLPTAITELLASMLADEASDRPSVERLARGAAVSGPKTISRRRVSAAVPLNLDNSEVWTAPQLASLVATKPEGVKRALSIGQIDHWLRRSLNEVVLAEKIETLIRPAERQAPLEGDETTVAMCLLRISRLLDPDAPLVWRGLRFLPGGLATLLAALGRRTEAERAMALEAFGNDALVIFAETLDDGIDRNDLRVFGRRLRAATLSSLAFDHLVYELNPALACRSATVARRPPATLQQVLPALNDAAAANGSGGGAGGTEGIEAKRPFIDRDLVAFIAARRQPSRPPRAVTTVADELRLLLAVGQETHCGPLPHLARTLAREALSDLARWPGKGRRTGRAERLGRVIEGGDLDRLAAFLSSDDEWRASRAEQTAAHERIRALDAERLRIAGNNAGRQAAADQFGREALSIVGAAASALALLGQVI